MTMMSTFASVLCSVVLGAAQPQLQPMAPPDPNAMMRPPMPRQQIVTDAGPIADPAPGAPAPTVFGDFGNRRITGIAQSRFGRVFVCSPAPEREAGAWLVAERHADGTLQPFPPVDPAKPLVLTAVTAVHIDPQDRLWIVDSANPGGKGVVRTPGELGAGAGPKLVCVELSTNKVTGVWTFRDVIAPNDSCLSDVRTMSNDRRKSLRDASGQEASLDPEVIRGDTNWAFITDAGGGAAGGAILAVDLNAARVRRLLVGHPSTMAEPGFVANVRGTQLTGGAAPWALNADAIAFDSENEILYWQPLGSRTLYSVRTAFIRDTTLPRAELAKRVNTVGRTVMASSMQLDATGTLYFTAVERDAIVTRAPNGALGTFVRSPALAWIDGLAIARDPQTSQGTFWLPVTRAFGSPASDESFKVLQVPLPAGR